MPSGVEHRHPGVPPTVGGMISPLRCPRALSTSRASSSSSAPWWISPLRCPRALSTCSARRGARPRRRISPLRCPRALSTGPSAGRGVRRPDLAAPMPSGVEHAPQGQAVRHHRRISPLRCPRALSTGHLDAARVGNSRILAAPMPSGVEHSFAAPRPPGLPKILAAPMPSGVEHICVASFVDCRRRSRRSDALGR